MVIGYLGSHRPRSDDLPARLESFRSDGLGRARRVVVRDLDVWWHLAVKHFQMMYDALAAFRDGTFELHTPHSDGRSHFQSHGQL